MAILLQTLLIMANESAIRRPQMEMTSYNNYLLGVGVDAGEERCYGSYGCYNLRPPWTSDFRPVSMYPEKLEKVQPRYPFYNRHHSSEPKYLDLNEPEVAHVVNMNTELPLFIVAHGFTESGNKDWIKKIKDELLLRENCNVVIVDWGTASSPPYTQAVANIRLAGAITAHLVANIGPMEKNGILQNVHCIGHSLGAHLCGYVGYTLQRDFDLKLKRITGMDPAEPHFAKNQPPVRLDRSAAEYVDVIHTDSKGFTNIGFGIVESIGHVDFYPNGGSAQPGCTQGVFEYISIEDSFFYGMKKYLACNHLRSYEFFTETINPKSSTISISCPSYQEFQNGNCFDCKRRGAICLPFGFHSYEAYRSLINTRKLNPNKPLNLYLLTGDAPPYCKGNYKVTVNVSSTEQSKVHQGEIGMIWLVVHSTSDGSGAKSNRIRLHEGSYYEPGATYTHLVSGNVLEKIKSLEIEFVYDTNVMNPLTWRIFAAPRLFVSKITLVNLETANGITVCPKDNKPLISHRPQLMIPSYCT